jgi:DnaJ-class molecular chaperone
VLGYFIGKAVDPRISRLSDDSSLAHYYKTLKVSPGVKIEEIKRSYRMLVKEYHPDLQGQVDEETGNLLKRKMATLNEAYGEIRKVRNF